MRNPDANKYDLGQYKGRLLSTAVAMVAVAVKKKDYAGLITHIHQLLPVQDGYFAALAFY